MKSKSNYHRKSARIISFVLVIAVSFPIHAVAANSKASPLEATATPDPPTPVKTVEQPNQQQAQEPKLSQEENAMRQSMDSLEFLHGGTPVTAVQETLEMPGQTHQASLPQAPPQTPAVIPEPVPGANPDNGQLRSVTKQADSMSMLVSESCETSGTETEGTVTCSRSYSNGNHATIATQRSVAGDESKLQTVITEFDKNGSLLYTKTIRERTDYNYYQGNRVKETVFLDIVYEPADGKATRELLIIQYDPKTGRVKSTTWTQYEQIGNEPRAGLVYHATLQYGSNGDPYRGVAEKWDHGQKVADFLNWSAANQGQLEFDKESWRAWETWIQSVSLQAYLP